jgi:hypothetical protein
LTTPSKPGNLGTDEESGDRLTLTKNPEAAPRGETKEISTNPLTRPGKPGKVETSQTSQTSKGIKPMTTEMTRDELKTALRAYRCVDDIASKWDIKLNAKTVVMQQQYDEITNYVDNRMNSDVESEVDEADFNEGIEDDDFTDIEDGDEGYATTESFSGEYNSLMDDLLEGYDPESEDKPEDGGIDPESDIEDDDSIDHTHDSGYIKPSVYWGQVHSGFGVVSQQSAYGMTAMTANQATDNA